MANRIHTNETAAVLNGVAGRMFNKVFDDSTGIFRNQRFTASRPFTEKGYKKGSTITVEVRFDDEFNNGHQSFAITGHVREPGARDWATGGCIHEEIAKYFPELAPLIKWHLMDTSGPTHYVANTCYHASNRDHSGRAAGEPSAWVDAIRFGTFPIHQRITKRFATWLEARIEFNKTTLRTNPARKPWEPVAVAHEKKPGEAFEFSDKWTIAGYDMKWHECPFDTRAEAQEFCDALRAYPVEFVLIPTAFSAGKVRDLQAARNAAIWPEATDEQLCVPRAELEAALRARLPGLIAAFRADMDAAGLLWEQAPSKNA
jgi:hypothetical protein